MTRIALIAALGAACLAGCSGEANRQEGEAVAVRDAARQVDAQGLKPQPGLYKTTITMTGLEIPGLPEGMEATAQGWPARSKAVSPRPRSTRASTRC